MFVAMFCFVTCYFLLCWFGFRIVGLLYFVLGFYAFGLDIWCFRFVFCWFCFDYFTAVSYVGLFRECLLCCVVYLLCLLGFGVLCLFKFGEFDCCYDSWLLFGCLLIAVWYSLVVMVWFVNLYV